MRHGLTFNLWNKLKSPSGFDVKMEQTTAGGFEYRGRGFRFTTATCSLDTHGDLFVEATGDRCGLRLVGVQFPGVASLGDLPGRVWEPDADELAIHADVFAEGGLKVRNLELWITGGRIACTRFDTERRLLVIAFRLDVQDGEYGREDEVDGVANCHTPPTDN